MHRPLSAEGIEELLTSQVFGHLACCDAGVPYIVPIAYIYHDNAIYGQTTEGRKTDILRRNPLVCFQVQQHTDCWRSVLCYGTFEELDFQKLQDNDGTMIVELLTMRLGAIQDDIGITVPFSFNGHATPLSADDRVSTVFRIVISEKTGREFAPLS